MAIEDNDPDVTYWREALETALEGVDRFEALTSEQYTEAAKTLAGWSEDRAFAFGEDCIPDPMDRQHTDEIAALKREIADREREVDCYRQSVARRRHVDVSEVYLDRSGIVIYGKG